MPVKNKVLCITILLLVFTTGLLSNAYAWETDLSSGWYGAATGCVTIKVDADKATVKSYLIDSDTGSLSHQGTCNLSRGTHKFDFKGRWWHIEDGLSTYPADVRNTGGGCGFKCLKMDGSLF